MFYRDKVIAALNAKLPVLERIDGAQLEGIQQLKAAQESLATMTAAEVREKVRKNLRDDAAPGALPTEEFDRAPNLRLRLEQPWDDNHAAMRHWAAKTLNQITICAVDGSQLPATKESPLPLAAVQVAWYTNPHTGNGEFTKDAEVEILTPDALGSGEAETEAGGWVNLLRHEREVAKVTEFMEKQASRCNRALVFFDGSLATSYAAGRRKSVRDRYRAAAVQLLRTSEECEVPLIAYIDNSHARDFARMLCNLQGRDPAKHDLISDAALLDEQTDTPWQGWRSPAFTCQREDVVEEGAYTDSKTGKSYSEEICFTYLKTSSRRPARLEFPAWLLRAGKLDQVVDWVRAESIVGGGYPYAIQAADAAAVISFQDRQRFLRAMDEFGRRHGIRTMQASAKQASKERRRA